MQNMVQGADVKQESLLKVFGNILTQKKKALEFTNQVWQKNFFLHQHQEI